MPYFQRKPNKTLCATRDAIYEADASDLDGVVKRQVGTFCEESQQWAVHESFLKNDDEDDIATALGAGLSDGKPTGKLKDVRLWHARLGHPGRSYMKKANKEYPEMNLTNAQIDEFYKGAVCPACAAGKIQKQTIKKSTPKTLDEVWSTDILGPFHPNLEGEKYTTIFVESKTGDIYHHHLKKRSDFHSKALPGWHTHRDKMLKGTPAVTLFGILRPKEKWTKLRGDNAREFLCATAFYDKHKVEFETCAAGDNDHVGKAEIAIKHIQRKSLSLLFGAKLDLIYEDDRKVKRSFFSYAIDMSVEIKMMLPYAGNNHRTPFEAVKGRKPTDLELAWLRTPFCTVYCKKETTNSRERKHEIGIFIGYSAMGKYRIFYPWRLKLKAKKYAGQTKVIFEEKQIVWDESLNHTTKRFEELRKYRDFHVLYEAEPAVPRQSIETSLAMPTDRETRSMARTRKQTAMAGGVSTRCVTFSKFNLVSDRGKQRKYAPPTKPKTMLETKRKSRERHRTNSSDDQEK